MIVNAENLIKMDTADFNQERTVGRGNEEEIRITGNMPFSLSSTHKNRWQFIMCMIHSHQRIPAKEQ
jgi:hypothetical protein